MMIKKRLLISFLFVICHLNNYGHEIKKTSLECTGKVAKERQPLFVQAEKHEENLINARVRCLEANDCNINQEFKNAKYDVLCSIFTLMIHLEELEKGKDGVCHVCEKTETKDIKERLTELLKSI